MKDFVTKYRELLTSALFLIVVFLVIFWLIIPLWREININTNKIQEKNAEREYQAGRLNARGEMREQYDRIVLNEGEIRDVIQTDDAPSLFWQLEKIADDTGNEIQLKIEDSPAKLARRVKEAEEEGSVVSLLPSDKYLNMSIELIGTYGSAYQFIKQLENLEYHNDIIAIQLTVTDEESGVDPQLSINPFDSKTEKKDESAVTDDKSKLRSAIEVVFYNK